MYIALLLLSFLSTVQAQTRAQIKEPTYKLESIQGPHTARLKKHLNTLLSENKDGYGLEITYSIKQSALIISEHKNSIFDNLIIKVKIKYREHEQHAVMQYQYCQASRWEYDQALYYMIAQKIVQMMSVINNRTESENVS